MSLKIRLAASRLRSRALGRKGHAARITNAITIATTHTFYDDAGRPHVSYENAAGASISEKAYHKTLENVFAHSETTLVSFPWLIYHRDTFHEWKEKSPTDIYTMLLDTYLNFSGEKEGMG